MAYSKKTADLNALKGFVRFLRVKFFEVGGVVEGADASKISKSTLYRRLANPDTFTIAELRSIRYGVHADKEAFIEEIGKLF